MLQRRVCITLNRVGLLCVRTAAVPRTCEAAHVGPLVAWHTRRQQAKRMHRGKHATHVLSIEQVGHLKQVMRRDPQRGSCLQIPFDVLALMVGRVARRGWLANTRLERVDKVAETHAVSQQQLERRVDVAETS